MPTEQHRQEEQSAAQENGGEEAVLDRADLLADHPDEPQEGDACERHQVQTQPDQGPALLRRSWSARRLASERARRVIVMAASRSTAKTIPATAADRRLRQNEAVSKGASVLTDLGPTDRSTAAGVDSRPGMEPCSVDPDPAQEVFGEPGIAGKHEQPVRVVQCQALQAFRRHPQVLTTHVPRRDNCAQSIERRTGIDCITRIT